MGIYRGVQLYLGYILEVVEGKWCCIGIGVLGYWDIVVMVLVWIMGYIYIYIRVYLE